MQKRHNNRKLYFEELAETCTNYFIPYINRWHEVKAGMKVMEAGCGEGGNLLPFARLGCDVTGVDIASCRIEEARRFFMEEHAEGRFIAEDMLSLREPDQKYDLIICHDVLEHIDNKGLLLRQIASRLSEGGIIFMSFPAWMMPFGGHQQICSSRMLSHLPFIHLLPKTLYQGLIRLAGESEACLNELLSIRRTGTTVEAFERLARREGLAVQDRTLYLINPHYRVKFGLKPRKLKRPVSAIPYLRDFLCSSCFYILRAEI
ncbi:MAG: methyltransferase domain-containing protein [Bacteroidaceae bacterium]|nr:methyltransferase domain-containing protein [Bacteroidaceae bacterium]